jgi:hypothetical protein
MPKSSTPSHTLPPPLWLLRLTAVSVSLAVLSLLALLWARWGMVVVLASDFVKYCF